MQLCGVLSFLWMLCQCVVHLYNVKHTLPTAAFNRLPDVNGKSITRDVNCRICLGPGSQMIFAVSNNFRYLEQNENIVFSMALGRKNNILRCSGME